MKATALFAAALAGCATVPPASAGPTAGLNQVATIGDIKIRPIDVVEDSRCPANVQCVWAGRLIVRARMNGPGWTQVRDFELGVFQAVDRYRVTLVGAEPPKAAPGPIEPSSYRFTFANQTSN
ncbi:hypothetical protein [Sphingomonas sp.]|uniref:hypothetical protein n=1 Tax=Sphingomonas sp. TaxID=28214 RepID=UPI0025E9A6CC|nr:hypothetical protein [Sphingomonas sp.]